MHRQSGNVVDVYSPGFAQVYRVPSSNIFHVPPVHMNITRYVLCATFLNTGNCNVGDICKFVHADVHDLAPHDIHINYAWRSVEEVSYPRLASGTQVTVFQPNSTVRVQVLPSERLLLTEAVKHIVTCDPQPAKPLAHCAHFYFNRTCHRGSDCQFVHAVYIDPSAKEFQRAPVPHMRKNMMLGADTPAEIVVESPSTTSDAELSNTSIAEGSTSSIMLPTTEDLPTSMKQHFCDPLPRCDDIKAVIAAVDAHSRRYHHDPYLPFCGKQWLD